MVKLVSESFVPVALNTDRLSTSTEDGKFFRALMKQWPQGVWVVTPEGKVLGFHYHKPKPGESYAQGQKRWVDETIEMLRAAIKESGPLTVREVKNRPDPLANRGRGSADGEETLLAVSVIPRVNGRQDGSPVIDSIHLSKDDWATFLPPGGQTKLGQEWTIPEAVARRFTPALSPMTDPIFSPRPVDVTSTKVTANVERVSADVAIVRYAGQWETAHNRDGDPKFPIHTAATGDGVGVIDTRSGKMMAMVWVLTGTYQNGPPGSRPRGTASVIEWYSSR